MRLQRGDRAARRVAPAAFVHSPGKDASRTAGTYCVGPLGGGSVWVAPAGAVR
jgi:hypothetical protein